MRFNLNRYLLGLSYALDCVEREVLGVSTNHGKRVAYIAMRMAAAIGLSQKEIFDIAALAVLHDNGLTEEVLDKRQPGQDALRQVEDLPAHCDIGEENVKNFPFQTDARNIIRYHHEAWDGSGFFHLQGDDIPLMAQIIGLADYTDLSCRCETPDPAHPERVFAFLAEHQGSAFSSQLVEVFRAVASHTAFWLDLRNEFIDTALDRHLPDITVETDWEGILRLSRVFGRIIDTKSRFTLRHSSGIEAKIAYMADWYRFSAAKQRQLQIAASLHDVGKLAVPNAILDKPSTLTPAERRIMQQHPYFTRHCLAPIPAFHHIAAWAANHHEKLNGTGYPLGLSAEEIDVPSRLLTVLDIYQALTEDRPYRKALPHGEAIGILERLRDQGEVDGQIVADVDRAFA